MSHRYDPADPFRRMPKAPTRTGRVELVAQAAQALLTLPQEFAQFTGAALRDWLTDGGDLVRDHLKVKAPRGSHATVQRLAVGLIGDEEALCRIDPDEIGEPLKRRTTRAGRLELLAESVAALGRGELPGAEAARFLTDSLAAYLLDGTDLIGEDHESREQGDSSRREG